MRTPLLPRPALTLSLCALCGVFGVVLGDRLPAQGEKPEPTPEEQAREQRFAADSNALAKFLSEYGKGTIRLARNGLTDKTVVAEVEAVLLKVAKWNDLRSAKLLFKVATFQPKVAGADMSMGKLDFYSDLRVWKVRALARGHITRMDGRGIDDWLLEMARQRVSAKNLRDVSTTAGAALCILGDRHVDKATDTILRATKNLKPEVRVQAVNALSKGATLKTVANFIDLLRDAEPNVRIAALNAIGRALGPHTDETRNTSFSTEVVKLRDQVITKVKALMGRERIWQVRAAARECLVTLRSKVVIPVLIEALKVELSRKKDPWALDIRLHRTLEAMTGQRMPLGQTNLWEAFWSKAGGSFAFAPANGNDKDAKDAAKPDGAQDRYQRFFKMDVESNRLLFVLDFSGSMAQPATLKTMGTASFKRGTTTTKAKLVKAEMRSIIMALPDNAMFNIVVFGEEVRVWRQNRSGRPALVRINDETRDDLLGTFLDSLHPRGRTNLYGALDKALDFGGRGLWDKYYGLGFDTMYILSDGAPTFGKVTDTDEIVRLVGETNRLKRITINTITFGDKNEMRFMKKLAKENRGRHVHVE